VPVSVSVSVCMCVCVCVGGRRGAVVICTWLAREGGRGGGREGGEEESAGSFASYIFSNRV